MVFKNSKWYTKAKDRKNNTYTSSDTIDGSKLSGFSNQVRLSDNQNVWNDAPDSLKWNTSLSQPVYQNQCYNSAWVGDKTYGWNNNDGSIGWQHASDDHGPWLAWVGTNWGDGLLYSSGVQDGGRIHDKFSRLGTATVAIRVGIRAMGDGEKTSDGSQYINYGLGSMFYRLIKGTSLSDITKPNWVYDREGNASFLPFVAPDYYGDRKALSNSISDAKHYLSGEFYLPWVVFKPTESWDTLVIGASRDNGAKPATGLYLFDPQLIVVPDGTTQAQLQEANIRVIPAYQNTVEETHPESLPGYPLW